MFADECNQIKQPETTRTIAPYTAGLRFEKFKKVTGFHKSLIDCRMKIMEYYALVHVFGRGKITKTIVIKTNGLLTKTSKREEIPGYPSPKSTTPLPPGKTVELAPLKFIGNSRLKT